MFALLRIVGECEGGVALELFGSGAPGVPDTVGELTLHSEFVAGAATTYVEPYDLVGWEHVLDEVEAGRDAVWREGARVAEVGVRLLDRSPDRDHIAVTVDDRQTTRVTVSLTVDRGWIGEQRALLHGIRQAWVGVHSEVEL